MKLKKEDLIESWKKYRLRRELWKVDSYNRSGRGDQIAIDTMNKRLGRILWSKNTPQSDKDIAHRKEVLRRANRIARETGETIDPSSEKNIHGYNQQFASRRNILWSTGTDLPKERRNRGIFIRRRIEKLKK